MVGNKNSPRGKERTGRKCSENRHNQHALAKRKVFIFCSSRIWLYALLKRINFFLLLSLSSLFISAAEGFLKDESKACGQSHFARSLRNINHYYATDVHRLVGAHICMPNAWPWTAQIITSNGVHRCGAALIDANYIVTAAHCFSITKSPDDYKVLLGGHKSGTGQLHSVQNFTLHPFYNVVLPSSYDVAVARIEPPANFSRAVRKVCLPVFPVPDNKICIVTGWGYDAENGNRSKILKEIHVPILSSFLCNDFLHYQGRVHLASMICAGYNSGGIDACQGDSGGPLFCEVFGRWELHGLVSWGNGCGRSFNPGVYTKIAAVVPWLRLQMLILH